MAVNLANVQESTGTLPKKAAKDFSPNYTYALQPTNTEKTHVIFKLVKKKKGRIHIDGVCDNVYNEKTKRRERIWLINGADSIWQSELLDLLKDKDYVKMNRRSVVFENGIARIPLHDERVIEFLRANTKNIGKLRNSNGKFDYYEYDAAAEQKERLDRQMLKINMVIKVKEMAEDKMMKLAAFLGVHFTDNIGMPKGADGIRAELMIFADNNPETVQKYLDSPEVDISYMVRKALLDAKIDLHGQSGNAIWPGGKGLIAKIPVGRNPVEYLTELAMTNSEDGKRFKEQLEQLS